MFSPQETQQFTQQHHLTGLTEASILHLQSGDYALDKAQPFLQFQQRINKELLTHSVIKDNQFCQWFNEGKISDVQARHFMVQFSVFSNQFLLAQIHKMLNAESLEEMHQSKEILANEIGVIFKNPKNRNDDNDGFGSTEGSVDGGIFHFRAAHFELLLRMAEHLSLEFKDLGKRRHGTESTLFFCDELIRLYGHEDYAISTAASYAVENWAAAGFWKQLVNGFTTYKETMGLEKMPITFFTWHDKIEANHAHHTQEELEEYYFTHKVDEDAFIKFGNEMLDGVEAFWVGLNNDRQSVH